MRSLVGFDIAMKWSRNSWLGISADCRTFRTLFKAESASAVMSWAICEHSDLNDWADSHLPSAIINWYLISGHCIALQSVDLSMGAGVLISSQPFKALLNLEAQRLAHKTSPPSAQNDIYFLLFRREIMVDKRSSTRHGTMAIEISGLKWGFQHAALPLSAPRIVSHENLLCLDFYYNSAIRFTIAVLVPRADMIATSVSYAD